MNKPNLSQIIADSAGYSAITSHAGEGRSLRYEVLVRWATAYWQNTFPDVPFVALWSSDNCGNNRARAKLKRGRKLKAGVRYEGYDTLDCPHIVPINDYRLSGRSPELDDSVGAFRFNFTANGTSFSAVFASAYYQDEDHSTVAIVLVPPEYLEGWVSFEEACNTASRYLERSQKVYIIGGAKDSFKPNVKWDDVILADALKDDIRRDMETFFEDGVGIYKQLNLAPFRKLLLVGPPGTGKTTLCAALAKVAIAQKRVVVYVSAADEDGATFHKIHHALNVVADSRHPVLLIVEEIDVYLRKEDKSQILNVLDGLESPNNPRGAMLLATTNYPEVIDERIAKRPGRVDRVIHIPVIETAEQAEQMLRHYMGVQWLDEHRNVVSGLVGQTGAFVREVALYARMLAANLHENVVSLAVLKQSVQSLNNQVTTGYDLLPRRQIGFAAVASGNGKHG